MWDHVYCLQLVCILFQASTGRPTALDSTERTAETRNNFDLKLLSTIKIITQQYLVTWQLPYVFYRMIVIIDFFHRRDDLPTYGQLPALKPICDEYGHLTK